MRIGTSRRAGTAARKPKDGAAASSVQAWRTYLKIDRSLSRGEKLAALIVNTPSLDWLLLTKRPENIATLSPWSSQWPNNVWLGTTVETQSLAEERLPKLCAVPAGLRFISCEPLLGPLDLSSWLGSYIHWVIAGGESGPKARPSDPVWFRLIRDQCAEASVPFHFKQWGSWTPESGGPTSSFEIGESLLFRLDKNTAGRLLDGRTWDELPSP